MASREGGLEVAGLASSRSWRDSGRLLELLCNVTEREIPSLCSGSDQSSRDRLCKGRMGKILSEILGNLDAA